MVQVHDRQKLQRKAVPHFGTMMHERDGKLICPLHNLEGDIETELIINKPEVDIAWPASVFKLPITMNTPNLLRQEIAEKAIKLQKSNSLYTVILDLELQISAYKNY